MGAENGIKLFKVSYTFTSKVLQQFLVGHDKNATTKYGTKIYLKSCQKKCLQIQKEADKEKLRNKRRDE